MKTYQMTSTAEIANERKEADWVREMNQHYSATGSFRSEDVRRVLGDQQKGVSIPERDFACASNLLKNR